MPVLANGVRVYALVSLVQLDEALLQRWEDHALWGQLFFGAVIITLMGLGQFFRDEQVLGLVDGEDAHALRKPRPVVARSLAVLVVSVALLAVGPSIATRTMLTGEGWTPALPAAVGSWAEARQTVADWRPAYIGADIELFGAYRRQDDLVDIAIVSYRSQRQGAELVNSQNKVADHGVWRPVSKTVKREISVSGQVSVPLMEVELASRDRRRLLWYWYDVGGFPVSSPFSAKFIEGLRLVGGLQGGSSFIALSTAFQWDPGSARAVLGNFVQQVYPELARCLRRHEGQAEGCA